MAYTIRDATYTGTDPDPVEWANEDIKPAILDLDLRVTANRARIDQVPLHATYGDDFTGASLAAKWTRVGISAGDETYQQGESASFMTTHIGGMPVFRAYTQPLPAGDFDAVLSYRHWSENGVIMVGLGCLDASNNGYVIVTYHDPPLVGTVVAGEYTSGYTPWGPGGSGGALSSGQPLWARVTRTGTDYYFRFSLDGDSWTSPILRNGFTPTKFALGRFWGAPGMHFMSLDRFNVR